MWYVTLSLEGVPCLWYFTFHTGEWHAHVYVSCKIRSDAGRFPFRFFSITSYLLG